MKDFQHEQVFTQLTTESAVTPVFKELDDEVAASCSGGARLTLYKDINFGGPAKVITRSEDNIDDSLWDPNSIGGLFGSGWNNQTSSIVVESGIWDLYTGDEYTGSMSRVGPGNYATPAAFGLANDSLTSIRLVAG